MPLPGDARYIEAWRELSSDRPLGTTGIPGPIPFSAIDRYAERYGFDDLDDFEMLRRAVRAIDEEFIGFLAKKAEVTQND